MQQKLDLTSFERAVHALKEVLEAYQHTPNAFMRDAAIQRFEFTYEISWKMLKRFLEITTANPIEIDTMTFQNLIRTGSEKGLLKNDWNKWATYRKARSTTSQVYDIKKANEVFAIIPDFLNEADFLLSSLKNNMYGYKD